MQFLQGRIFTDPAMPSLEDAERNAWSVLNSTLLIGLKIISWLSAIETLAALHKIVPSTVGLDSYGRASGFYARQLKTFDKLSPLQAQVIHSDTKEEVGPIPHWSELTSWFHSHIPQDRSCLVHGDYKIDNCVFHATEPRVIGLLDWELSTIGHPLSDLANLLQPHGLPTGGNSGLVGFLGREDLRGIPTLAEAQERYTMLSGWNPAIDWTFAEAFAHLRVSLRFPIFDRAHANLAGSHHTRHCCPCCTQAGFKFKSCASRSNV